MKDLKEQTDQLRIFKEVIDKYCGLFMGTKIQSEKTMKVFTYSNSELFDILYKIISNYFIDNNIQNKKEIDICTLNTLVVDGFINKAEKQQTKEEI